MLLSFRTFFFYNEINQYYSGNYTFGNKGKKTDQELSKVNKRVVRGIAIVCLILAVLTVGRLAQIHYHAQSIPSEMEACMEEGGTAVIEKSSLWSLTKFTCE
ncbi:hypothetical protein [Bacillus sp. m3-13]|uniref:hypothetical protein n=1 Tax=Bacillus sp. m3-13 TaxID=406124 RepID=UPI0001E89296|nr:hypothetical protein [Bacillus sp. m3-13]